MKTLSVLVLLIASSLGYGAYAKEQVIKLPSGKEIQINLYVSIDKDDEPYLSLSHSSQEKNLTQEKALKLAKDIMTVINPDIDSYEQEYDGGVNAALIMISAPMVGKDWAVLNRAVPISNTVAYNITYEKSSDGMWQMSWPKEQPPIDSCVPPEKVYFSCELRNKIVSICGSTEINSTSGYLQYRIGKPFHTPELELPHEKAQPQKFFRYGSESRSATGSIQNLSIDSGEYNYTIYRFTHAFEGNSTGIAVKKSGEIISYLRCQELNVLDNLIDLSTLNLAIISADGFVEAPE